MPHVGFLLCPKTRPVLTQGFPRGGPLLLQGLGVRASSLLPFSSAASAGEADPDEGPASSPAFLCSGLMMQCLPWTESLFTNLTIYPLSEYPKDWGDRVQIFSLSLASDYNIQIGLTTREFPLQSIPLLIALWPPHSSWLIVCYV